MYNVVDAQMLQVRNWSSTFHQHLQKLNYSTGGGLSLPLIDTMCLSFLFDARFNAAFDGLDTCPRLCSSAGATLCIYNAWFRLPASGNAHFLKRCFEVPMPLVRSLGQDAIICPVWMAGIPISPGIFENVKSAHRMQSVVNFILYLRVLHWLVCMLSTVACLGLMLWPCVSLFSRRIQSKL